MMGKCSDKEIAVAEVAVIVELAHDIRVLNRGSDFIRDAGGEYTADAEPGLRNGGRVCVIAADGHEPHVWRLTHVAFGCNILELGDVGGLGGRDEGDGGGLKSRNGEGKTGEAEQASDEIVSAHDDCHIQC